MTKSNQHLEVILASICGGVNVDEKKININNSFFFAIEQRDMESTRIQLRQHGVDHSAQNAGGVRAMQVSETGEDKDMVVVLSSARTVIGGGVGGLEDGRQKFVPFRSGPIQL